MTQETLPYGFGVVAGMVSTLNDSYHLDLLILLGMLSWFAAGLFLIVWRGLRPGSDD